MSSTHAAARAARDPETRSRQHEPSKTMPGDKGTVPSVPAASVVAPGSKVRSAMDSSPKSTSIWPASGLSEGLSPPMLLEFCSRPAPPPNKVNSAGWNRNEAVGGTLGTPHSPRLGGHDLAFATSADASSQRANVNKC